MNTDRALRTTVALTRLEPCIMCGGKSDVVAMFSPDPARAAEFGAPPGQKRLIFYAACLACLELPEAPECFEAILRHGPYRVVKGAA